MKRMSLRRRRSKHLFYIMSVMFGLLAGASACDTAKDEKGLMVHLHIPNDDVVSDVRLWVYQQNGLLVDEYHYAGKEELASAALPLDAGEYVLIAASNLVTPFSTNQAIANDMRPYEGLAFTLDDASASPAHAHYGVQTVTVNDGELVRTEIKMTRILAEMQFTIKGVPADVTRAEAKITNVAKSLLPYSGQLMPLTDVADLGSVIPVNGVISFPMKRLMPVVNVQSRAGTDAVPTLLQFTFLQADGETITFKAETPILENGGTYTPEVVFDVFRPDMTVTITDINGWKEGGTNEGEILNPKK